MGCHIGDVAQVVDGELHALVTRPVGMRVNIQLVWPVY